jgi:hypothetical protein
VADDELDISSIPFIDKIGKHSYTLIITKVLKQLTPPPSFGLDSIDPEEYFITSGDAIQKVRYLSKILWKYAGTARCKLRTMSAPTAKDIEFEKLCWEQAGASNRLLHILKKLRGSNVFLETEWNNDRKLVLHIKNPRSKTNIVHEKTNTKR